MFAPFMHPSWETVSVRIGFLEGIDGSGKLCQNLDLEICDAAYWTQVKVAAQPDQVSAILNE